MKNRIQNEGHEYAVITHSRTFVSYCGIGRNGRFQGSWPLKDTTMKASMVAILKVFEGHGVKDYEVIEG